MQPLGCAREVLLIRDGDEGAKLDKVNQFHAMLFSHYLNRLATTQDGERSLLDSLTLLYSSGMSDGNTHNHHDLPTLLIGGNLKGGRHLRFPAFTPVTNLFLGMLGTVGVPIEQFGDSTGELRPLTGV